MKVKFQIDVDKVEGIINVHRGTVRNVEKKPTKYLTIRYEHIALQINTFLKMTVQIRTDVKTYFLNIPISCYKIDKNLNFAKIEKNMWCR